MFNTSWHERIMTAFPIDLSPFFSCRLRVLLVSCSRFTSRPQTWFHLKFTTSTDIFWWHYAAQLFHSRAVNWNQPNSDTPFYWFYSFCNTSKVCFKLSWNLWKHSVCMCACDCEVGQNPLLRGKFIPVAHCDNNLLQVGAGGQIWPAETWQSQCQSYAEGHGW